MCQFCGKKNRIPTARIGQQAKCGSCSKIITDVASDNELCLVCRTLASSGVHLSNGKIVHDACLSALQYRQDEVRTEIDKKQWEISRIQQEIEQRNSIVFKFKSFFSKPHVEVADLNKSISALTYDIEALTTRLSHTKKELVAIYDYFLSYPPDWEERRESLINKEGNYCSECGRQANLHVHHIQPLSKGGSNELSNLKLLCEACHSSEHGGSDFSGEFSPSETAFSKRVAGIRYAIIKGMRIQFGYKKPTDMSYKQRTVHPVMLINIKHRRFPGSTLCVQGYCELRRAERTFALKRMRDLKVI